MKVVLFFIWFCCKNLNNCNTLQLYLKYSISSLELYIRFPCFMHHGELPKASAIQRRQLTISPSYIIVPVVASNPNTGMSFRLNNPTWAEPSHLIRPKQLGYHSDTIPPGENVSKGRGSHDHKDRNKTGLRLASGLVSRVEYVCQL